MHIKIAEIILWRYICTRALSLLLKGYFVAITNFTLLSLGVDSLLINWCNSSKLDLSTMENKRIIPSVLSVQAYNKRTFHYYCNFKMSCVVRKPAFCIFENKDADQLRGNREADQRLCFRYTESTIPLLSKSEISRL